MRWDVYVDLPEGTGDSVHPERGSNKTQVFQCFQRRCNRGRPGLAAAHCLPPPVCCREGLKTHSQGTDLWKRVDLKRIWSQWLPAYDFQLTAERRELLRLGVRYDGSQSLLPVLQLTCLQYVVPVFHHHCTDQLQQKKNFIFKKQMMSLLLFTLKKILPSLPWLSCSVFV